MILTARGPEQQSHGVNHVLAFINLALALGKAGRACCGYGCLTGQGNGQGGREHGQKADQLPGYRRLDNPEHRAHMAKVWGIAEKDLPAPGQSAYEMLSTLGTDGGVRALLVFGSNPAISAPRAAHIGKQLEALDFLMVADFFLSETAERADVVLPSAQWAEEEGTTTNLEGRVLYRQRAMPPPAGVRTDLEVLRSPRGWDSATSSHRSRRLFSRNSAAHRRAEPPIMRVSPTSVSSAKTVSSGRAPTSSIRELRECFLTVSRPPMAGRDFMP
ncbi:MAG TPA: molybdopterin-dependent oxidoreductase [Bryobacteraceae bacterium]|nr:molybdopterin-dependent oxidoreductase [Bryobacteraceae bacterium]